MSESPNQALHLQALAEKVAEDVLAPRAEEVDREGLWPEHSLRALAEAGLFGLHVPRRLGGHEQGLATLAGITEILGKRCSSSALCFAMHCVGSAVIAAKATNDQEERYLRPIAEGRHLTTLALSESGTGAHFYLPSVALRRDGEDLLVDGEKQFITNGGHADSYVVSTTTSVVSDEGDFSCLVVDRDTPGTTWLDLWQGMGMRGNSSRGLRFENARVPAKNLLGREGDQIWFVFEAVAPYFLIGMAGTYLGIAQAAYDLTAEHLRGRSYSHSGESLADHSVLQCQLAEMWVAIEKSRHLLYHAAHLGDLGDRGALVPLLSCKADVADTVVMVVNQAMTLCGGMAYRANAHLARLLRDARASHVMSPTTNLLKQWTGRALLDRPLF